MDKLSFFWLFNYKKCCRILFIFQVSKSIQIPMDTLFKDLVSMISNYPDIRKKWYPLIPRNDRSCFNGETQNFGFLFFNDFLFFLNQLCVDKERFSSRP